MKPITGIKIFYNYKYITKLGRSHQAGLTSI